MPFGNSPGRLAELVHVQRQRLFGCAQARSVMLLVLCARRPVDWLEFIAAVCVSPVGAALGGVHLLIERKRLLEERARLFAARDILIAAVTRIPACRRVETVEVRVRELRQHVDGTDLISHCHIPGWGPQLDELWRCFHTHTQPLHLMSSAHIGSFAFWRVAKVCLELVGAFLLSFCGSWGGWTVAGR